MAAAVAEEYEGEEKEEEKERSVRRPVATMGVSVIRCCSVAGSAGLRNSLECQHERKTKRRAVEDDVCPT